MNKDMSLLEKMNIQTNAVVINQTPNISENFSYKQQVINDRTWKFYSMSEKGVGRSRNNALMRASDDIIVMADEDEVFVDGYEKIINEAYSKYPDADMIIFNVRVHKKSSKLQKRKNKVYNS
ncbi:MAG: glycosyltransferase family A protein [Lactococcus lactis]